MMRLQKLKIQSHSGLFAPASMNQGSDEYRSIAPVYDPLLSPFLRLIRSRVVSLAMDHGLRRVLDLCCGTGEQSRMLRQQGILAFGIDLSPAMLARAVSKRPQAEYVLGDAARLPFQPGSFDGAILSFALHEKSPAQQRDILQQAQQVLTDQGTLIVIDFCSPGSLLSSPALLLITAVERLAGAGHFANFRQYMKAGGLQGLLQLHPGLETMTGTSFFMATVALKLVRVVPTG